MDPSWLECRSKRKYSPLFTFQRRLRHLREIGFRNLLIPEYCRRVQLKLLNSDGDLICDGGFLEASKNPHWKNLSIGGTPASKDVTVHIFADEQLLVEWRLYFSGLIFISRHWPNSSVIFAPNSMLVLFAEGVYCDKTCFEICDKTEPSSQARCDTSDGVHVNGEALCDVRCSITVETRRLKKSYGINAFNRLYTNERAILRTTVNAHNLRRSLEGRIDTETESPSEGLHCQIESTRVQCTALRSLLRERSQLLDRESKQMIMEENIVLQKQDDLAASKDSLEELKENLCHERERVKEIKRDLESLPLLKRQLALICELDEYIYPVRQVPKGYTVCSVFIPSALSDLRDSKKAPDDQVVSTGMAYLFHLVTMLSTFTGVPLIYPLKYEKNNPVVVDVSLDAFHHKEFPLWVRGKDRVYFEHAVPLLALNVADLRIQFKLPSMRGRLMSGLWNLVKHFRQEQARLGPVESGDIDVCVSNHMTADDWMAPSLSNTPEHSSPMGTPRLSLRIHSVPNLVSHSGDSLELDSGAASDHGS